MQSAAVVDAERGGQTIRNAIVSSNLSQALEPELGSVP